jgi:hypothetical protein
MFSPNGLRVSGGILTVVITTLLVSSTAQARVWRCDGVVQFRPCEQSFSVDTDRSERAGLPLSDVASSSTRASLRRRAPTPRPGAIAVLKQKYRKVSSSVGHWYGRIGGNGPAHLYLEIFHQGKRISKRYMGNVNLTPDDKSISFNFTGPIPKIAGWTWKVRAGKYQI